MDTMNSSTSRGSRGEAGPPAPAPAPVPILECGSLEAEHAAASPAEPSRASPPPPPGGPGAPGALCPPDAPIQKVGRPLRPEGSGRPLRHVPRPVQQAHGDDPVRMPLQSEAPPASGEPAPPPDPPLPELLLEPVPLVLEAGRGRPRARRAGRADEAHIFTVPPPEQRVPAEPAPRPAGHGGRRQRLRRELLQHPQAHALRQVRERRPGGLRGPAAARPLRSPPIARRRGPPPPPLTPR